MTGRQMICTASEGWRAMDEVQHLPTYLTFDCYGTLVDFDLRPVTLARLGPRAAQIDRDAFFAAFETNRFLEVLQPYRPYREVLLRSLARTLEQFGLRYEEADGAALVAAVPGFGPFPEVPPVLERLRRHCRLAIVSNSDDDLMAGNLERIGVPFDRVITSEQAHAYKPSPQVFDFVLRELGCSPADIVHVAQGFDYDIKPTHELGWPRRIWINRRRQTGDPAYGPYAELPDLAGLPALLGLAP
jgi:2-haloacid dehalogenase